MTKKINRRTLIRSALLGASAVMGGASVSSRVYSANGEYDGKFLMCFHLDGGADVTCWVDPKENTPGEPKISYWADNDSTRQAGGILYAPFADNEFLFEKYHDRMLVINGIDAQTNSHETGKFFNWSGFNAEGRPTLPALFAAAKAPTLPMAYTSLGGGYASGGDMIRFNKISDPRGLSSALDPFSVPWAENGERWRPEEETTLISEANDRVLETMLANTKSPRKRRNLLNTIKARASKDQLTKLKDLLPQQNEFPEQVEIGNRLWFNTQSEILGALTIFAAGVGCSADVVVPGFDTHDNHDELHTHLYNYTSLAIDYMWNEAERLGIADRLVVVISSDFGRTNMYNAGEGKDHWPILSTIVMEKNASWGSRTVGKTDDIHNALKVDPKTLKESSSGTLIFPSHVHKSLQKYLGIHDFASANRLGHEDLDDLEIFNPSLRTVG